MTRSPLIFAALALSLILGGCGSRSIGNKIDDQFVGPDVANAITRAHADLASPTSVSYTHLTLPTTPYV